MTLNITNGGGCVIALLEGRSVNENMKASERVDREMDNRLRRFEDGFNRVEYVN